MTIEEMKKISFVLALALKSLSLLFCLPANNDANAEVSMIEEKFLVAIGISVGIDSDDHLLCWSWLSSVLELAVTTIIPVMAMVAVIKESSIKRELFSSQNEISNLKFLMKLLSDEQKSPKYALLFTNSFHLPLSICLFPSASLHLQRHNPSPSNF